MRSIKCHIFVSFLDSFCKKNICQNAERNLIRSIILFPRVFSSKIDANCHDCKCDDDAKKDGDDDDGDGDGDDDDDDLLLLYMIGCSVRMVIYAAP